MKCNCIIAIKYYIIVMNGKNAGKGFHFGNGVMVTEKFRKRVFEDRLHREETWFNMGTAKSLPSRLRLIYFTEEDCFRGKNIFPHSVGLHWIFHVVLGAERRLLVHGGGTKQLLPTDIYVEKPLTKTSPKVKIDEILENPSSTPVKRYYFAMERNVYAEQMFRLNDLEIIHLPDVSDVRDCVMEMAERIRSGKNCSAQELSVLLFRFLTLITCERREYGNSTGDYEQKIEAVRRFPQNYPTLKSLESAFQVSPVTLRKIFYRFTGHSPIDFVVYSRLKNSCWMLTNSELSIGEIALLNGYSSAAFYTKSFKKVVGVSPGQYRREGKRYFPDSGTKHRMRE